MMEKSGAGISSRTLQNGLRVVLEPLNEFASVSVGVWVLAGSRDEPSRQSGITHFIEHLAFKGTPTRDAKQIALEIDSLGGSLNAFTGKEHTSFYARVLGESLPQAMDVLSDITLNCLFHQEDVAREKDVILQEISMVEDTPDDLIHDLHCREFWSDHSLGMPILGTEASLKPIDREMIAAYHRDSFLADRIIVTAAGALDPDELLAEVTRSFSDLPPGTAPPERTPPEETPRIYVQERSVEQVHFCVGYPGLPVTDDRRYAMALLNTVLGGGMSSRLFQKIREEYGLAYSVYSYHSSYQDTGMQTIYCGTSSEGFPKALDIIREEAGNIVAKPIPEDELATARLQLKGNLLLGLESTGNRMNQLARNEIYHGRQISPSEIEKGIDAVTREHIQHLAADLFREDNLALTVIGPVSEEEVRGIWG